MLSQFQFTNNISYDDKIKNSFFQLAHTTFGIRFSNWSERGFWGEEYIPYCFLSNEQVIANVSVNLLDLIIDGKQKRAVQIGTVMTHPEYRSRGLSKQLMNKVMNDYEHTVDFFYLFANKSVLDFYPKFGFNRIEEYQYYLDYYPTLGKRSNLRKLDMSNKRDLFFVYHLARKRIPVANRFATARSHGILMFYCLEVFRDDIYFHEGEEAVVIFQIEEDCLDVFDVVSTKQVNLHKILDDITGNTQTEVVFHFTPDERGLSLLRRPNREGDSLFVKSVSGCDFPKYISHPITAKA
ncbi:GNAT family N-acetyltransferase [Metabacillus malikii]|uniref:GNAT superfamily N-acetyltransferase n=1 Tax=Metabacillus malikii TaxID=1504265 RepID=A0ABT9Z9P2_9BACI|nr:GNAT family N-acetyltransferase [Metabacillus malikii]MDQ0228973.1 GNAT superfamily N-acetyltransferase [Metabacillus malikii]